jgi:hypothetical protein
MTISGGRGILDRKPHAVRIDQKNCGEILAASAYVNFWKDWRAATSAFTRVFDALWRRAINRQQLVARYQVHPYGM